ncbi:hypothetical protein FO519_004994 [Halicephalobus sp. NKZ332]|nr:hypothetical protein FO519_004994 [Halicephalobus sp. NKZ332]
MNVAGFPHQVGGHFGLLKCVGHVLKPLNQREFHFYVNMDPKLLPFTVKYCGRIRVNLSGCNDGQLLLSTDAEANCCALESAVKEVRNTLDSEEDNLEDTKPMTFRIKKSGKVEAEMAINTWAGQCQSKVVEKLLKGYDKWFIMLEDIVSDFRKPCVIDLKMGQRQYGDDSSAQKRLTQTQKCRQSTSEELGIRLVGLQLYDKTTKSYSFLNKYEGRRMDRVKFYNSLEKFFISAGSSRTKKLIRELQVLRSVLSEAESFRFFSSSLLIAFDGASDSESLLEIENSKESIVVKMIDFAHSTFRGFLDDKVYSGMDDGYLLGIDSLISTLEQILISQPLQDAISMPELSLKKQRSLKRPYSTPPTDSPAQVIDVDEPIAA